MAPVIKPVKTARDTCNVNKVGLRIISTNVLQNMTESCLERSACVAGEQRLVSWSLELAFRVGTSLSPKDESDSGEEEEWSEDSAAVGSAEEGEDGEGEESAGDETGGQENIPLFDRPNAGVEEAKPLVRIFIGGVPLSVN